jgi:hypothetical protein
MKSKLLWSVVAMLLASVIAQAQDSRFPPTGQQIPVPECLAVKGLWTGGVKLCSQTDGMNAVSAQGMTVPLRPSGAPVGAIQFHSA